MSSVDPTPRLFGSSVVEARGDLLCPGFIDLQVNGGIGHNFEDTAPEEMRKIIDFYLSHGTTSLLPTTVTASIDGIRATIARVKQVRHPAILGMHIEGPFISEKRKGAQNPEYILEPSIDGFNELVEGHEGVHQDRHFSSGASGS